MAPPSKKRKEAPQNGSLLDFFSTASTVKKGKIQTDAREVIVIDSDDEDSPSGKCIAKTAVCDPASLTVSSVVTANAGRFDGTLIDKECVLSFGKPSSLLLPDGPLLQEPLCSDAPHSSCKAPGSSTSVFGVANLLLKTPQPLSCNGASETLSRGKNILSTTNDCQMTRQSTPTTWSVDVDAMESSRLGSEEWDAGDDERVADMLDGEGATEGNPDSTQPLSCLCPICNRELSGVSEFVRKYHGIEKHSDSLNATRRSYKIMSTSALTWRHHRRTVLLKSWTSKILPSHLIPAIKVFRTYSRCSWPLAKRIRCGRKQTVPGIVSNQLGLLAAVERRHFTRSCRACLLRWMPFDTALYPV